jgi:glutamate:GABA antiporter
VTTYLEGTGSAPEQVKSNEHIGESTITVPRVMGLVDLILFYTVAGFSLQWIASAAAAGSESLLIWPAAFCLFYVPLVFSIIDLSSRYPADGGLYVWTREAFGEFAGFICGWCYWFSNLPYFANVLYFGGSSALFVTTYGSTRFGSSPGYFVSFSLIALLLITVINLVGLKSGKWIPNIGAIGMWVAAAILVTLGVVSWIRFGAVNPLKITTLSRHHTLQDVAFWGTLAFAFCGAEAASFMGDEIRNPKRTIPRALFISGSLIVTCYFVGTLTTLASLPADQISNLAGPIDAIRATAERLHCAWIVPVAALAIALGQLGAAGSFLAACARIPFAIGVDRRLPAAFARIHPRWGTPYVALIVQSAMAAVLILLSQAGASVRSAYSILVSMTIIANFIPYLFMFAALTRLNLRSTSAARNRLFTRPRAYVVLGTIGFVTALVVIALSFAPPVSEADSSLATVKMVGATVAMLAVGTMIFVFPRGRSGAIRRTSP